MKFYILRKKIIRIFKEEGICGLLNRIRTIFMQTGILFEYNLEEFDFSKFSFKLPKYYSFQYANEVPLELLEKFSLENRKPGFFSSVILRYLDEPNIKGFCILYKEREVASLGWLMLNPVETARKGILKLPIVENVFYPFDGWVVKDHRGNGFHKYIMYKRREEAKRHGRKFGYSIVYSSNIPALKDNDKFGKRIGKVYISKFPKKMSINIYDKNHQKLYFKKHLRFGG